MQSIRFAVQIGLMGVVNFFRSSQSSQKKVLTGFLEQNFTSRGISLIFIYRSPF
jgi:hypothetical protein